MASRVGAVSTADVGKLVTEQRRKREREAAERAPVTAAPAAAPTARPTFGLHYTIENCGDGSVRFRMHASAAAARKADEAEPEPFAEPTVGCLRLRISQDGGTIEVLGDRGTWVKLALADDGAEG